MRVVKIFVVVGVVMAVFRQGVVAQTSESRQEQRQACKQELVTRGVEAGTMSRLSTTQMAQLLVMSHLEPVPVVPVPVAVHVKYLTKLTQLPMAHNMTS